MVQSIASTMFLLPPTSSFMQSDSPLLNLLAIQYLYIYVFYVYIYLMSIAMDLVAELMYFAPFVLRIW